MCRRDHGLTWTEFERLTLAELEALEERRAIEVRHARFNSALIASAIINSRGTSEDGEPVSPFDFLAGFETDPEEAEKAKLRKSVKHAVRLAFTQMRGTPEEVQAEKAAMITRMTDNGIEDAEELIREVYPDL